MRPVRWLRSVLRRLSRPVPTFPIEFHKCRNCGSRVTVAQVAFAGESSIAEDTFPSLEKKLCPIQDFTKISTPTTRVLVRHYDNCARCGSERCTRVEQTTMATDALMQMLGMALKAGRKR